MPISKTDLTGQKFNMLTVLKPASAPGYYLCACDCGKRTGPILGYSLKSGNTKSCGCLRRVKDTVDSDDGQEGYHNPDRETKRQTTLGTRPRRLITAGELLQGDGSRVLGGMVELMRTYDIVFAINKGKPVFYRMDGRWFGGFDTPIEAMGHALYYGFGTRVQVKHDKAKASSPYSRYRGVRDIPDEAL